MNHSTFWLTANDRSRLYVNQWLPEGQAKAMIMLSHGMAEHSGRYAHLAAALCAAGYGLYALDQRGHGRTADEGTLGLYAEKDGWNKVVGDLASLNQHIGQQQPGLPIILLGTAWAAISPRPTCCTTVPAWTGRFSAVRISSQWRCTVPRG